MKAAWISILLSGCLSCTSVSFSDIKPEGNIEPVTFDQVKLTDHFWAPWQKKQGEVTIPTALNNTEPAVENLRRTAHFLHGIPDQLPVPHRFVSSDLFKIMESAAYSLQIAPDSCLESQIDAIIDIIDSAQQEDGYLYEAHICGNPIVSEMGDRPYAYVLHSHELYDMGHMYEGAVAYYRATGKEKWLKIAEKNARHIQRVFFEGDPNYNDGKPVNQAPGHEEIELALCQLYRVTGDTLYLDMARRFLDIRGVTFHTEGTGVYSPTYAQQHLPVRQQTRPVGHAVRALYLYTGMADVDALSGTNEYASALDSIWTNTMNTRIHITGGLGAMQGIEGFGGEYQLPNRDTYNETCAAVANVFFNNRMFLASGDGRYADALELSLFNNALAGINLEGNRFFYVNPLETDGKRAFNHGLPERAEWFYCACCPPNISRLLMQISGYMYAHSDNAVYATLYASSETEIPLKEGRVKIVQQSDYPFDGKVQMTLQLESPFPFVVYLRIPTWTGNDRFVPGDLYRFRDRVNRTFSLKVNGRRIEVPVKNGFVALGRNWHSGDRIELELPMPVRLVKAHEAVAADRDRVAVTRGPLVYCAEGVDNDSLIQRLYLPTSVDPDDAHVKVVERGVLKGIPAIDLSGGEVGTETAAKISLIPYFAWNNRGIGAMSVWLPETEKQAVEQLPVSFRTSDWLKDLKSSYCFSGDDVWAVVDGVIPVSSSENIARWTSYPQYGKEQFVQFDFTVPKSIGGLQVFWYDDGPGRAVSVPVDWHVEYQRGNDEWVRMEKYVTDQFGTEKDRFNLVHPAEPMVASSIRIVMQPKADKVCGITEVQFDFVNN